jgi:hypothetical protein
VGRKGVASFDLGHHRDQRLVLVDRTMNPQNVENFASGCVSITFQDGLSWMEVFKQYVLHSQVARTEHKLMFS